MADFNSLKRWSSSTLQRVEQGAVHTARHITRLKPRGMAFSSDDSTRSSAIESRWKIGTLPSTFTTLPSTLTTLPKASTPPSPFLPSEIKYSATLVRGQAVTHIVLGLLLFVIGVLGTRTGNSSTCSAGVWCGMAAIMCGISGLLAHRLWYKNWAIKGFLVSSAAVIVLCVLGMSLTFYYALVTSHLYVAENRGYLFGHLDSSNGTRIKDIFFDLPPSPPSRNLIGNLLVGLVVEVIISVWSLIVAWRGVRAEEFTTVRREELVKQVAANAPKAAPGGEAEAGGVMPLAALYHLMQVHPDLLPSNLQWQVDYPPRAGSHVSMDYHERVSRYLCHAQGHGAVTQRKPSSASMVPVTKRRRCVSAAESGRVEPKVTAARATRSKSEHRHHRRDETKKLKDTDTESPRYTSSSSPMSSSSSPESPTDCSPSSTLTRLESSESTDNLDKGSDNENKKESQHLVLSLKTLSPLSSHVIRHSEMMPGKSVSSKPQSQYIETNEKTKGIFSQDTEKEYNVSFSHTSEKPPPLPKKEYARPKLVINKKLHKESERKITIEHSLVAKKRETSLTDTVKLISQKLITTNNENVHNIDTPPERVVASVMGPAIIEVNGVSKATSVMGPAIIEVNGVSKATSVTGPAIIEVNGVSKATSVMGPAIIEANGVSKATSVMGPAIIEVNGVSKATSVTRKRKSKAPPPIPAKGQPTITKLPDDTSSKISATETATTEYKEPKIIYKREAICPLILKTAKESLLEVNEKKHDENLCHKPESIRRPLSIEIRPYETKLLIISKEDERVCTG